MYEYVQYLSTYTRAQMHFIGWRGGGGGGGLTNLRHVIAFLVLPILS